MEFENNVVTIKREYEDFDEVYFTFRYMAVNNDTRILIETELSDINLTVRKMEDAYVITFPLTKEISSTRIKNFNEKIGLDNSQYGIFIAFTSYYDHGGFRLPQEIKDFYHVVGGELDCSIITR